MNRQYIEKNTVKSKQLGSLRNVEIPDYVNEYYIEKENAVYDCESSLVYRCKNKAGDVYAIKFSCGFDETVQEKIKEKLKLKSQKHLVPILEMGYLPGGIWYQIFPYYQNGNLSRYKRFGEDEIKKIASDINDALHFLHEELEIIHMDVKPDNIYLSNDSDYFLLGDYDTCIFKSAGENCFKNTFSGSLKYAPVGDLDKGSIGVSWDYGALGMTLLELGMGESYFSDVDDYKTVSDRWKVGIKITPGVALRVGNLISGLTQYDCYKRWGYMQVHKWCEGIYIKPGEELKRKRLMKCNKKNKLDCGLDEKGNRIEVNNLTQLSRQLRLHPDIMKKKYIDIKESSSNLIEFIKNKSDNNETWEEAKKILEVYHGYAAIEKLLILLNPRIEYLVFKGEKYISFVDMVNHLSLAQVDEEFIRLVKGEIFKRYLNEDGNEEIKKNFNEIIDICCGNDELMYYIIIYFFGNTNGRLYCAGSEDSRFCREIIGINQLKEAVSKDDNFLENNLYRIEAYLATEGLKDQIKIIQEVVSRYE